MLRKRCMFHRRWLVPAMSPIRSDRRRRQGPTRCRSGLEGRGPAVDEARRPSSPILSPHESQAPRHPHWRGDSRNRPKRRRPYIWRRSREARHGLSDAAVIGTDDVTQILRIHASRHLGGADKIAKHHRELTTFRSRRGCHGRDAGGFRGQHAGSARRRPRLGIGVRRKGVPQSPQNFLPAALTVPQDGQDRTSGEPQSLQKGLASGLDARHCGHSISLPELAEEFRRDYRRRWIGPQLE